ncbi:Exopolysaccharide biosynthesis protein, WecB/TagA/CpsF family [Hyella patelloides LEGE 07179]|uniref:Exopolysaccharide biosynthesis protein, WecB/TagA/CpsF family n=2 Tax=Hyella TaxID=945733 RepID=A0A563W5G2_9CYAN|nr:Exopolysaccharide biosynthesis protein, WecB/TagA/CpsF family [Hyella patelloides LEGE 07179]
MHKRTELNISSVYFFNRRVDLVTIDTVIKAIFKSCRQKVKIVISNYNVHAFNLSMSLPLFLAFHQYADITVCDGMGILKALEFMGTKIDSKYKVSLTSMIPRLLNKCERESLSVFLLGSKPQNLNKAIEKQKAKHPNLLLAGHHGYFDYKDLNENQIIIDKINKFKPDILIVGMGMPLQELWIQNNYDNLETLVIIPCGAVIDRLAGLVPTPPRLISNAGLEWLYRLIREPKRLATRYLLGNPLFLFYIFWAKYHDNSIYLVENENVQDINITTNEILSLENS